MALPRMLAVIVVGLLIGLVSFIGISATMTIGPMMDHGTSVQHVNGKILQITGPDRDFILETPVQQMFHFECHTSACRATLGHLQRHTIEKAPTDVYYKQGPNDTLLAIDVD